MFFKLNESGKKGESIAVSFLKKNGYEIIEKNYKVSGVEIDIIAKMGNTISFIEVKTRKSNDFGFPEEFVNREKSRRIIRGAKLFFASKKNEDYLNYDVSLDIISVIYGFEDYKIEFIQNAYDE
jgi:putative endonuclease